MKHKSRLFWMATGLALASTVSVAQAAKPTEKERAAMAERVKQNSKDLVQPRTMAQGEATRVRMADGSAMALVPTDLWNHLVVTTDAQGQLTIHDTDGSSAPVTTEGSTHE